MAIAFPFVEVAIDTSGLQTEAQRAPGVLAIVGKTMGRGSADANDPIVINELSDALALFNNLDGDGLPTPDETPLYKALRVAFLQDPRPSKIYAVKLDGNKWDAALKSLEATDDATFVCLADAGASGVADANLPLIELKKHCEAESAAGNRRIGVAHIDPDIVRSDTYAADAVAFCTALKSSTSRMIMIAARGAVDDDGNSAEVSAAAASAIAGQPVATSLVLKKVKGFSMPLTGQYSAGEIKALSEDEIIPVIDPALVTGESMHFAEGTCYTTDESLKYIDIVRLLDQVEFNLKAGLIGLIGDASITRAGLAAVIRKSEGILGMFKVSGAITNFSVLIPVYDALLVPEAARDAVQQKQIFDARSERLVDLTIVIVIGPAIHRLKIALQPSFV